MLSDYMEDVKIITWMQRGDADQISDTCIRCETELPISPYYEYFELAFDILLFVAIVLAAYLVTLLIFYIIFKILKIEHPFKEAFERCKIWFLIYFLMLISYIAYFYITKYF